MPRKKLPHYTASAKTLGANAYGDERSPDMAAPADTSRVLRGILGAGSNSGSRVPLSGTSLAAPQVTRMLADFLSVPANRPGFVSGSDWVAQLPNSAFVNMTLDPSRAGRGAVTVPAPLQQDMLRATYD